MDKLSPVLYELGYEMGIVDRYIKTMWYTFESRYGDSDTNTKMCHKLSNLKNKLESELDDFACNSYPLTVTHLPGHNIKITDIFYNINRITMEEADLLINPIRPYPKTLSKKDIEEFSAMIGYIGTYILKVNGLLSQKGTINENVKSMLYFLDKLTNFLKNEVVEEK